MKSVLSILALALMATSCSTAYKSGQTPDDVYYSPERKTESSEYVQMNREDGNRQYRNNRRQSAYNDPYAYNDDRYLRMKVRNRQMWSDLDYYYSDPYAAGYYNPYRFYGGTFWSPYSYWNAYNHWNYYYNPYHMPYGNIVVINPITNPVYNKPRTFNLNTFNRGTGASTNPKRSNSAYQSFDSRPSYRSSNAGNWGSDVRRSFSTNNNSNNSYSAPSRSSSSSSGSSSSNSSSSGSRGSSAPVRRF